VHSASLGDGQYFISLNTESSQTGGSKSYKVTVETGTVTSILDPVTGNLINPVNGVYTLRLAPLSISGVVVNDDGTTPVPDVTVRALSEDLQYETSAWSDKNGAFAMPGLPDSTFQVFAMAPYYDQNFGDSPITQATVSSGQGPSDVRLQLQRVNVKGTVAGPNGVSPYNYIEVFRILSDGSMMRAGSGFNQDRIWGTSTNSQGKFAYYLTPGDYVFSAQSDLNKAGGTFAKSETCRVTNTSVAQCNITLLSSNFKAQILKSGSPAKYKSASIQASYIYEDKEKKSQVKNMWPQFELTNDGNYATRLEDGRWQVTVTPYGDPTVARAYFTATVTSGSVSKVVDQNGVELSPTAGVYSLGLVGTNLNGTITGGSSTYINGSSVRISRDTGDKSYSGWIDTSWSNGTFGFRVDPGTYTVEVQPYYVGSQDYALTRVSNCVVPATGSVTCNVALASSNFKGRITNEVGTTYTQAYANIFISDEKGNLRYLEYAQLNAGVFSTRFDDGIYVVTVYPYWEKRNDYSEKSYEITVSGSVVTQVKDRISGASVIAVDGVYPLALATPSLRGKVLAPGSSTTGIANALILFGPEQYKWTYSTYTDESGNFAINLPNGSYKVQAMPKKAGNGYGQSALETFTISGGSYSGTLSLRLRAPNLTGRVVTPGASPLPAGNVNVNIWIGNEYFYSYTDSEGRFAAFVETASPDCPAKCSIELTPDPDSDYIARRYSISGIGDLADKALGTSTLALTVLVPGDDSSTTPNKWGYVSVEEIVSGSNYSWVSGSFTNTQGVVKLSLEDGKSYRVRTYPGYEINGKFNYKELIIGNYSASSTPTLTSTFDKPNLKVTVKSRTNSPNSFGWYYITKLNSGNSLYEKFSNGYLNEFGEGSLFLGDGSYKIRIFPGKITGVETEYAFTVTGGTASGTGISTGAVSITLPAGNVSGRVVTAAGAGYKGAVVGAVRVDDSSIKIAGESLDDGYFEFNLDRRYQWTISSYNPSNGYTGSINVATSANASDVISGVTLNLTTAP
jgi:hypothetical protein